MKELELWKSKSSLCKHPHGCVTHVLYNAVRTFAMGYST